MKPFVLHASSFAHCCPDLQLSIPFSAYKGLPCYFPPLSRSRKIAGKEYASLLWVRVRRRSSKPIHLTVFFLKGDGADEKNDEDEWYAMEPSHVKLLVMGVLKRWALPVAVGAMAGSIVARKALVFVTSFSFVLLMVVHKALEAQGMHLNDVFSRHALNSLLTSMKLLLSTAVLYISGAIMACIRSSSMHIRHLLTPMCSLLADLVSSINRKIVEDSALGSDSKSTETLITDINACIQNVEVMIMTQKDMPSETKWIELKKSLASLKTKVATLSKGDLYAIPSTNMSGALGKVSIKKRKLSAAVKSEGSNLQKLEVDKMSASRVDTSVFTSVKVLKQDAKPGEVDVVKGLGDDVPLTGRVASTKWASEIASETALDQEYGLLFKESSGISVSDAQPLVKIGEHESCSKLQPKYIDYWTEQDQDGSSLGVEQQMSKELSKGGHFPIQDSVLGASQDVQRENESKASIPDLDRKSLHFDERASSVNNEVGSQDIGTVNDISVRVNDESGSKKHVRKAGLPDDDSKKADQTNVKQKAILSGSQNLTSDANVKGTHVLEQGAASLGSTKELAFVREDADLHVLTGFSRRMNDGEFQKLMTDGETALRHGKAGLFGDMEVGEAETMLYKAADHFASAAALDPSSVEALGFWGNTLLVHGELKLMLTREFRHMISTPDVISPYWMRRNKGTELSERSNPAALQQTFQGVCEECEELLIQAGRKYRRVLSINNSEVRALYNWGLALCFRAQLIAEEGGQDALEAADRIYLAAIDKFEAMMGISQRYAPGAMFNWGLTLKNRSRLRPPDSTERIDLLQQAKQLFIDALKLQPDDAHIRSAFVTCSVELKELNERQEVQSKRSTKSFFGKR